ncbi:2TM domain-containing protein [Flavobacterium algicola]|uniref:2TM domain-containing protein n=1 Tax=Flavobacterium algicola TaxID=556529 RepID=UPI001EFD1D8A|nr:2TM domain-containing protein [Flavobacterium algicola]MCG9794149.1 2TM domain-containing protein [Flavobacterium algicola]
MERDQHELYEYARRRIKEKKRLYYHFVLLVTSCLFAFVATKIITFTFNLNWLILGFTLWAFIFILHFIKVFITNRFMNKNWEREQIDRLVAMQVKKISELKIKVNDDSSN